MSRIRRLVETVAMLGGLAGLTSTPSLAQQSNEELAKAAQNPLASPISLPFQLNTNFDTGPEQRTQNVLNIQPVVPFSINEDWNLISRAILPLIWQPASTPFEGSTFGLGDVQLNGFLSPKNSGNWIWGVGAVAQLLTHTNDRLGNDRWGLGPTPVVLHLEKGNPWVFGALVNNIWSVSGSSTDPRINQLTLQPFLNYNFPGGFYLTSRHSADFSTRVPTSTLPLPRSLTPPDVASWSSSGALMLLSQTWPRSSSSRSRA